MFIGGGDSYLYAFDKKTGEGSSGAAKCPIFRAPTRSTSPPRAVLMRMASGLHHGDRRLVDDPRRVGCQRHMQRHDIGRWQKVLERDERRGRSGRSWRLLYTTRAPTPCSIGARHFPTEPNPTSPTVRPPSSPRLSSSSESSAHPFPAASRHRARQASQRREHQQQRELGHGARIGARHVAHRHAAALRRFEIDGVDAHAELLNQLQPGRRFDVGRGNPLEHVQQHIGIGHLARERGAVGLRHDGNAQPVVFESGDFPAEAGRRAVMQNGFHACVCPELYELAAAAESGWSPSASSILSTSFHLAVRSTARNEPTFSWPTPHPMARCTIVTSSVSPERAEMMCSNPPHVRRPVPRPFP